MSAFTEVGLRREDFMGFATFTAILDRSVETPAQSGVYVVVNEDLARPDFLATSTGGHFKKRDPSVAMNLLSMKWIEAPVLYIGMATSIRQRLSQFAQFGSGKPVGHWGGRYIWQIPNAMDLSVAWKGTDGPPRNEETQLLRRFNGEYGALPFANLVS